MPGLWQILFCRRKPAQADTLLQEIKHCIQCSAGAAATKNHRSICSVCTRHSSSKKAFSYISGFGIECSPRAGPRHSTFAEIEKHLIEIMTHSWRLSFPKFRFFGVEHEFAFFEQVGLLQLQFYSVSSASDLCAVFDVEFVKFNAYVPCIYFWQRHLNHHYLVLYSVAWLLFKAMIVRAANLATFQIGLGENKCNSRSSDFCGKSNFNVGFLFRAGRGQVYFNPFGIAQTAKRNRASFFGGPKLVGSWNLDLRQSGGISLLQNQGNQPPAFLPSHPGPGRFRLLPNVQWPERAAIRGQGRLPRRIHIDIVFPQLKHIRNSVLKRDHAFLSCHKQTVRLLLV